MQAASRKVDVEHYKKRSFCSVELLSPWALFPERYKMGRYEEMRFDTSINCTLNLTSVIIARLSSIKKRGGDALIPFLQMRKRRWVVSCGLLI